jgi:hypothetical protein
LYVAIRFERKIVSAFSSDITPVNSFTKNENLGQVAMLLKSSGAVLRAANNKMDYSEQKPATWEQ